MRTKKAPTSDGMPTIPTINKPPKKIVPQARTPRQRLRLGLQRT